MPTAAVAVPRRKAAPEVLDTIEATQRLLGFQALCSFCVRQRCRGIDIDEAARHHTLADACGRGYLVRHLVAFAHRHALDGEVAPPTVPDGAGAKL